jgi:peptidoglycan/xylan/chitin deacetylase (PgdA/CDA1 family)
MLLAINFHYIRNSFNFPYPSIFGKTPEEFKQQLIRLKSILNFVSQDDIVSSLEDDKLFPKNASIITFDDGLKEQYELALPILDELNIPAIFYVNTSNIIEKRVQSVHKVHMVRSVCAPLKIVNTILEMNPKIADFILDESIIEKAVSHYIYDDKDTARLKYILNFILDTNAQTILMDRLFVDLFNGLETSLHDELYMSNEMLSILSNRGYLGSHGHTHRPIGLLPKEDQLLEIALSQEILSNNFGKKIKSFSFPYGSFESAKNLDNLLLANHYKFAFTMERAKNLDLKSPFLLARIDNNDAPGGKSFKGNDYNFIHQLQNRTWNSK